MEIIVLIILMSCMVSLIVVSYGKQQEKYNNRRLNDNSRNNTKD